MKDKIDAMFGSYIRMRREQLNLTQEDVAESLGLSRSVYSRYEKGDRTVSPDTIFKLQKLLNFSVDDFFKLYEKWEGEHTTS